MKRNRKTVFALLLALVMTLGLAATAGATEVEPTNSFKRGLSITKEVKQTGDVTPPAETFTFVLEDAVKEGEKHDLAYYGITQLDELKIPTATGNEITKTFSFELPASDFAAHHWDSSKNVGSDEIARYYKSFLLKEQNDGKAGWQYSTDTYAVTFTYRTADKSMELAIHVPGNDVYYDSAKFTNTYIENLTTVKIPFTKTVKLGGNTGPGKTDFKLEIFNIGNGNADDYKDVTYTAAVTTNGAGSYNGELVISGPAAQVRQFVCEGFYVREVNDNLSGWTYSDAVWCVEPEDPHGEENVRLMKIYPATMEKGADGEFRFYKVEGAAAVDKMTFENTYTYNTSYTTPDVKPTSAPKTFDAGVALYGVSALLSLSGTALVIKRKKG